MEILLLETYPITKMLLKKAIAGKKYCDKIILTNKFSPSDILFSDERYFYRENLETNIFLVPGDKKIINHVKAKTLLTFGMKNDDSVSFSSIGEDRAFICLQKEITLKRTKISPFETGVPYDRNLSVERNLILDFFLTLFEIKFGDKNGSFIDKD